MTSEPEFVTNYEIGAETDFMLGDMPARLNANLFSLDYEDIQRAAEQFRYRRLPADAGDFNNNGSTEDYHASVPTARTSPRAPLSGQGAVLLQRRRGYHQGHRTRIPDPTDRESRDLRQLLYVDAQYDNYDLVQYPDPLKGGSTLRDCNGGAVPPRRAQQRWIVTIPT